MKEYFINLVVVVKADNEVQARDLALSAENLCKTIAADAWVDDVEEAD